MSRGTRLNSLTGLRFFAALYVVAVHAVTNRTNPGALVDIGLEGGRVAELGYLGVPFFFVLSGFVLTWSAAGSRVDAWDFYRRRFARVYPMHFATTLLVGAALIATGGAVAATAWPLCLLLVQAWVPHITTYLALNPVSWSLACEAFFYALTPMLLAWAARRSTKTCVTSAVLMVALMAGIASVVLVVAPERDKDIWSSPWFSLGSFTAGMALALVILRGWRKWPSLGLATVGVLGTVALLIALSWNATIGHTEATVLALPAVVVLIGAAAIRDVHAVGGWLTHRWLVRLGEWSFALYLIHKIVFNFLTDVLHLATGPVLAATAVAVSIAASGVAYHCYERPLEKVLRPARRAGTSRTSAVDA